jgi:hypothetical protein
MSDLFSVVRPENFIRARFAVEGLVETEFAYSEVRD